MAVIKSRLSRSRFGSAVKSTPWLLSRMRSAENAWMFLRYRIYGLTKGIGWAQSREPVCFWPELPYSVYVAPKVCYFLGRRLTGDLMGSGETLIYWMDQTYRPKLNRSELPLTINKIVNEECWDISKSHLDKVHSQIFGYCLGVDPLRYHGTGVVKSDLNAKHDGKEMEFPLQSVDPSAVYQICIDNVKENGMVEDIRIPIFNGTAPFVYLKYRPRISRFSNVNHRVVIADLNDVLDDEEKELVFGLTRRMGLDYGELDCLRDSRDGKIYVVDINSTPAGPPNGLCKEDHFLAIELMAKSFSKTIGEPSAERGPLRRKRY